MATMTFYVSHQGNDLWSGRLAEPNPQKAYGPFATLHRARKAIRKLKASTDEKELRHPVTVVVRGGIYSLCEPLWLGPEDSGTQECPVFGRHTPTRKLYFTAAFASKVGPHGRGKSLGLPPRSVPVGAAAAGPKGPERLQKMLI